MKPESVSLRLKRAGEPPAPSDGLRILVDRLWPRGISKDAARLDAWVREIAPSHELRKWYGHDPARWAEFRRRYVAELDANPEGVAGLCRLIAGREATFVHASRSPRNNARVLKEYLESRCLGLLLAGRQAGNGENSMTDFDTNKLCERIVRQAPDAILFADNRGIIQLWNQGAERIFGYPAAEAIGQSLDLIIPEKLRNRHGEGYARVMESGESKYGTDLLSVPAMHRDGRRLSVDFCIVMLKDDQGRVEGIAAVMRDVSERHTEMRRLRERIAELEGTPE
ncbi:PAS domain S-box-containing protein [Geothermobacter ehrlichii]|uniref:PAS domain S-box-containing protein n=1 Tax=Geothermobacter ehrlichii TaxID=213224 RepID=A0A5D3WK70_9BACT|nr:DUF488 family protein [Geothermobacter ehrlichii]TYO96682.1 PAS domain S-box-containing protein [Geothermobacter ehrlichii]